MTKLKVALTAVFAAIIFAFICFIPVVQASAFGAKAKPDELCEPDEPQIKAYDNLYYFSTNENCAERFSYIQEYLCEYDNSPGASHTTKSELINWSESEPKMGAILNYFGLNKCEYNNSFIIFELTGMDILPIEDGIADTSLVDCLEEQFRKWEDEDKGCKIMFICDEDEEYFRGYYEENDFIEKLDFLWYADIHVNSDVFFDFYMNVLYYACGCNFYNGLRDCTFVFDKGFSYGIEQNPFNNVFVSTIYKYLICSYTDDMFSDGFIPIQFTEVFARYKVNLLFNIGGDGFYDLVNDRSYCLDDYNDYVILQELYGDTEFNIVGSSWPATEETVAEFFGSAGGLAEALGVSEINKFFYNPDNLNINITPYSTGELLPFFEDILASIVYDFIMGNDLTVYDNWEGRCDISYKPYSPDGWLYCLRNSHLEINKDNYGYKYNTEIFERFFRFLYL